MRCVGSEFGFKDSVFAFVESNFGCLDEIPTPDLVGAAYGKAAFASDKKCVTAPGHLGARPFTLPAFNQPVAQAGADGMQPARNMSWY